MIICCQAPTEGQPTSRTIVWDGEIHTPPLAASPALERACPVWCTLPCPFCVFRGPFRGCARSRASCPTSPATQRPCRSGCCHLPSLYAQPLTRARFLGDGKPWSRSCISTTASNMSLMNVSTALTGVNRERPSQSSLQPPPANPIQIN